jgi:hypothetical protein
MTIALFGLVFTLASVFSTLTRHRLQVAGSFFNRHTVRRLNHPPIACKLTVSCSISLPYLGFFSPFPRGTVSLSVTQEYLALPRGRGRFTRDFTCPVLLGIQLSCFDFRLQDFYLLWCSFQLLRLTSTVFCCCPTTPPTKSRRFRLFPFRSPLLGESHLLSFPLATKMFQFTRFARTSL